MEISSIPVLPQHHPDCCLSISQQLLQVLQCTLEELPKSALVLSVGSGSGLLENLLQQYLFHGGGSVQIEGVEVQSTSPQPVNIHLPEEAINTVLGTWDVSNRVQDAHALLFVYPRDPRVVASYIDIVAQPAHSVRVIIWLGPKVDWAAFEPSLHRGCAAFEAAEVIRECGLVEYEMMVMMQRKDGC